ncbi:phosphoribosylamine-glycine ligase [Campylobacter blaseri]|uniref:Phosphoribosylamine--glycine ligase n=1 Tax=Campylobacter blaseri TaxID=2042961 RepID=A0A2P8R0C8_9BACT|nr:phosphoribosylamine--glycine ligase [Campylobacter blaseri]PSM51948.1 phosphoribosylamine--glycine ligase [Campylobacter blaseri]PSM53732.1 phosphoribosylamine--glycine ligase [Campylobacter blaseri]QKF85713.1 phosphoribosylamine-glycine ligase [Campylobacter blaseri]
MNILIIGSGGREYSIGQKLKSENKVNKIYFSPGNGATARLGENIDICDFDKLANFAIQNTIDLTIVGPEAPLSAGIVDIFKKYNLAIFGPTKAAARLESSKAYMKDFLAKNNILTAKYINSDNYEEISDFIDTMSERVVVKADGLCAGKGVIIANNHKEAKKAAQDMLSGSSFGDAGKRVVVEEYLDGFELSFFAICDGENYVLLPVAQDHKRLLDNDEGPNTGGMGAYAPSPLATKELIKQVEDDVIKPTLKGMKQDGNEFCGVLFVGIMVVNNTPYVLEFNVRFGDPECEAIMPLIDGNLSEILYNASIGKLEDIKLEDKFAVAVVISSKNYPYSSSKPELIHIETIPHNSHIAYAGVSAISSDLYADGGRVLVCVGVGDTINKARDKAYELCKKVKFKGMHYRKDIAYQVLK